MEDKIKTARELTYEEDKRGFFDEIDGRILPIGHGRELLIQLMVNFAQKVADKQTADLREKIRRYIVERSAIGFDPNADPIEFIIGGHYQLGEDNRDLRDRLESAKDVIEELLNTSDIPHVRTLFAERLTKLKESK